MEDIKELESNTDKILSKSRATRGGLKSKSCERDREHRSVPRLSDIRLFKDIEKTDEASTPLHLESFDNRFIQTKSNLGTLGALVQTHTTQGISNINSKYIKADNNTHCSHHYTDLNTDKRGGAGCDLSHGEHEAIPFSMVSS